MLECLEGRSSPPDHVLVDTRLHLLIDLTASLDFFYTEVTLGQLQQCSPDLPASAVCAGIKGVCATSTQLMLFLLNKWGF